MSKEVFHSLVELNAMDEIKVFDDKYGEMISDHAKRGLLNSGATIRISIKIGIDILEKVLEKIQAIMGIYWNKHKVMGLDITGMALDELDKYINDIEGRVNQRLTNLKSLSPVFEKELSKQISEFRKEAGNKISHTSNILKSGISPNEAIFSLPQTSQIDVSIEGQNVINSVIYGDLNQTINEISKANPDLTKAIKELLETLEKAFKDNAPEKFNEGVECISTLSEEVSKPAEKRRRFTILSCMDWVSKLSAGIEGADKIIERIFSSLPK